MKIIPNKEIPLNGTKVKYIIYSKHRVSGNKKSVWIIAMGLEFLCFENSYKKKYIDGYTAWGFILNDNKQLSDIGKSKFGEFLKIAKFLDGNKNGLWHGYPADHVRNNQDRPSVKIMNSWKVSGIIKADQIRKIRQGLTYKL